MQDLLAARLQMAASLGFHIVFAGIGMAFPLLMAAAHWFWLRTHDESYRALTKAWSKGLAIFFAVGAVSGTALSFELGLLWPGFMRHAGAIIGMPFSWEGAAFFLEAIALGLFLYGWDRLTPWVHWLTGLFVGLCGVASAIFVVCANAWMNSPQGFDWVNGQAVNIDPYAAMFNPRAFDQGLHMVIAAVVATGTAVAGVHAVQILRGHDHAFHRHAVRLALSFASIAALLQPLSGDLTAKRMGEHQPLKLAAVEALFTTQTRAPMLLGGWPDAAAKTVAFGLEIPGLLSFLAKDAVNAEVKGLDAFPRDLWPPLLITHAAYQLMVAVGTALAGLGGVFLLVSWRKPQLLWTRPALWLVAACLPLGFLALEAGWTVTEVGRQPWIIYGVMKTAEALTPMPGLGYTFALYMVVYALLCGVVFWLMQRQIASINRQLGPREFL